MVSARFTLGSAPSPRTSHFLMVSRSLRCMECFVGLPCPLHQWGALSGMKKLTAFFWNSREDDRAWMGLSPLSMENSTFRKAFFVSQL